jgi:hypothetical protein
VLWKDFYHEATIILWCAAVVWVVGLVMLRQVKSIRTEQLNGEAALLRFFYGFIIELNFFPLLLITLLFFKFGWIIAVVYYAGVVLLVPRTLGGFGRRK